VNHSKKLALFLGIFLASTGPALATTLTFNFNEGTPGEAGNPLQVLDDDENLVLTVTGYFWNGSSWSSTGNSNGNLTLYRRDEPDDHGLGVCNPNELSSSACDTPPNGGGGDINELDNDGTPELMLVKKEDAYDWVSLGLSSLDGNGSTDPANWERGILWGADSASLAGVNSDLSNFEGLGGTILEMFVWDGSEAEPDLDIDGVNFDYLIFQPFDWSFEPSLTTSSSSWWWKKHHDEEKPNKNNDFLIRGVVLTQFEVPEPSSLLLLLGGLALIESARRRRA
jgi:hypothetical protein